MKCYFWKFTDIGSNQTFSSTDYWTYNSIATSYTTYRNENAAFTNQNLSKCGHVILLFPYMWNKSDVVWLCETRRRLYFTALGNCHQVVPSRNYIFTNNRACRNMNRGNLIHSSCCFRTGFSVAMQSRWVCLYYLSDWEHIHLRFWVDTTLVSLAWALRVKVIYSIKCRTPCCSGVLTSYITSSDWKHVKTSSSKKRLHYVSQIWLLVLRETVHRQANFNSQWR